MHLQTFSAILIALRAQLVTHNLDAYIVPTGDAHYTEFVAECQQRRAFISGFTGSAGTAIVTKDYALLWTDGRYYIQAEHQLDSEFWTLMKDGLPETPSMSEWLKSNLTDNANVGVDPALYSKTQWDRMETDLKAGGKNLVVVEPNLVDQVWPNKPPCAGGPIFNHGMEFTGKNTATKVADIRKEMRDNLAEFLIVTELDEIAWLLNLRGSDVPYSSIFFGYAILKEDELTFFVNQTQLNPSVNDELKANVPNIDIRPYDTMFQVLKEKVDASTGKIWFNQNTNYAIVNIIPTDRQIMKLTPIALMKATKNPTEVIGYKNCLIRDAAALCEFFAWIKAEMAKGTRLTELSASARLHEFRKLRQNFVDDSFHTISAAGENAALPHYMPTPETDRQIRADDMYLLDSGGLYRDGTTDITRTVHFGTPTPHQKNCYTRVLKGQMALATAIFPGRTVGSRLDSFARQFLWEAGLDYNHGTGHGIGSFLNVHEGPFSIGSGNNANDPGLRESFFTSNEPGYYEEGAFGIRLENLIRVRNVSLDHNFQNRGFIGFEDLTFVPYEHQLIDFSILTEAELEYLNNYQQQVRRLVGAYLKQNNMSDEAYNWMMTATRPVNENGPIEEPTPPTSSPTTGTTPDPGTSTNPPTESTTAGSGMKVFEMGLLSLPVLSVIIKSSFALV